MKRDYPFKTQTGLSMCLLKLETKKKQKRKGLSQFNIERWPFHNFNKGSAFILFNRTWKTVEKKEKKKLEL